MGEDAVDLRLQMQIYIIGAKVSRAQQHVAKITVIVAEGRTIGGRRSGTPYNTSRHRNCRGGEKGSSNPPPDRPDQKAMSSIAKVHFVGVDDGPLCSQPPYNVSTHGRRENLIDDQPND